VQCLFSPCKFFGKQKLAEETKQEFVSVISAYTSGIISKESNIRVSLVESVDFDIDPTSPISEKLLQFSPKISGEAYWLNKNTI
jgi:hypothetical protein